MIRPDFRNFSSLESQLQPQLHGAGPARSHGWIGGGNVRRGAAAAEATHGRIVKTETILSAIGISKVWMVKNVEELRAKLRVQAPAKIPVLGHREIKMGKTGAGDYVVSHGARRCGSV